MALAVALGIFAGTGMDVKADSDYSFNLDGASLTINYIPIQKGITIIDIPSGVCTFDKCGYMIYRFGQNDVVYAGENDVNINYGTSHAGKWKVTGYTIMDYVGKLTNKKVTVMFEKVEETTPATPDPSQSTGGQNDSKDAQKQPAKPHSHSFEWTVTKEPTKTEDGLEEYKCRGCGAVEASQPISMYMLRVKEFYGLVKDAPKGGAVAYDFGDLSTISDYVLAKMAERNDVAVTVSFTYGGEAHSITFPAGTDYAAVLEDAETMYGFYGVAAKLGLTVE